METDDEAGTESEREAPEQSGFGVGVGEKAKSGAPQEHGRAFETDVSTTARETHQPPAAPENLGVQHRPESQPTAESNPGTAHRP